MKPWMRLAARIYPRSWRDRYGTEFQALLDDVKPGWRELLDVTRGALIMRLTSDSTYWKLGAIFALAGAIMAGGLSFAVADRYVSTAVLKMPSSPRASAIQQELLSRGSLTEIIQRPSLDLYHSERQREPMEDIVALMRRDIQIHQLLKTPDRVSVSFAYPDKEKARAVTRALVTRMAESNVNASRFRTIVWSEVEALRSVPMPTADNLEVLDPPSVPVRASGPNRLAMMAAGLGSGFILGLLAAAMKRRRQWILHMAAFGAAGCALGAIVSFLVPDTYVSSAVMLITPPTVPEYLLGALAPVPLAEWLPRMQQQVLSDTGLHDPGIRIRALGPTTFQIAVFSHERLKAQKIVAKLVTGFTEQNIRDVRERWRNADKPELAGMLINMKLGANLEVVDSASLPEHPVSPNRLVIAALGLIFGLIVGGIVPRFRANRPQPLPAA
jgi:hypothetical protein